MAAVRESTLGDAGNLNAPPGSREWAVAVRLDIQATLNDIKGDATHLGVMVELIRDHKGYRQLADHRGRKFATFEGFCTARQPFGLGYAKADIEAIIRERTAKAAQDRAENPNAAPSIPGPRPGSKVKGKGAPNDRASTVRCKRDSDYYTARIARDRPDILERMKAGEFRSVRQATLEAGIVKPTVQIPLDPEAAARVLARHFKGARREALLAALGKHGDD